MGCLAGEVLQVETSGACLLLIYDQRLNSLKPLTEGSHLSILKSLLRALEEVGSDASSIRRLHAATQQALQNPVQSYASEHRTVMGVTPGYRTIGSAWIMQP
jgi:hypothetical protein